jgi:hypothetical protein
VYEPETYDAGEQAFDTMGMFWAPVKAAIENSIRKASCTVYWQDGNLEHDLEVVTFWADPERLKTLPELGGETTDDDDPSADDDSLPGPDGGGRRPGGAGGPAGGGIGRPDGRRGGGSGRGSLAPTGRRG